jgi:hypothetical protein
VQETAANHVDRRDKPHAARVRCSVIRNLLDMTQWNLCFAQKRRPAHWLSGAPVPSVSVDVPFQQYHADACVYFGSTSVSVVNDTTRILISIFHLVPRLRMCGAIPPLPYIYVCVAWWFIMHQGHLYIRLVRVCVYVRNSQHRIRAVKSYTK